MYNQGWPYAIPQVGSLQFYQAVQIRNLQQPRPTTPHGMNGYRVVVQNHPLLAQNHQMVAQARHVAAQNHQMVSQSNQVVVVQAPKNGKKNRRPSRNRTSSSDGASSSRQETDGRKKNDKKPKELKDVDFTVGYVKTKTPGIFFRKRSPMRNHICLRTFTGRDKCVVFQTPCQQVNKRKFLTTKQLSKVQRRKYCHMTKAESCKEPFMPYISKEEADAGLANGTLIKGTIRINPKQADDAYVNNEDTSQTDYYLNSVWDRNRAMEGDEVVLQLKPKKDWVKGYKTAVVVHILEKVHPRVVVGFLRPSQSRKANYALLSPRDRRCPVLRLPFEGLPFGFRHNPKKFEKTLFVAKIVDWPKPAVVYGSIQENLGESGNLDVETASILRDFCLDVTPFDRLEKYIPKLQGISQEEIDRRKDLRKECIFTIDPSTARDLDDAVSAKQLPNGNFEIGVHISDASFYLDEGSELDKLVQKKATSIYMVDRVYHMLPEELCLYCSLLPGEDKLAFSVIWEMTPEAEIVSRRFARSVVNSCCKLSYEQAQQVIDDPDREFTDQDFPRIYNGFASNDLVDTIDILQFLAEQLTSRRVENGALKIDQIKLNFDLDLDTGEPLAFRKYENMAAHRLIEEFMLLANISAAEKVRDDFPEIAFLRCHVPPKQIMLEGLKSNLANYGIHIDISDSKSIRRSLEKWTTDDESGQSRAAVLNHLTAKTMARARYFCASTMASEDDYKHFALSVPIYTHFTSPIRRYADIMVHRLLAATLDYYDPPSWNKDDIARIAANCNAQKYNAKRAGDASADLFLGYFIDKHPPFIQKCVVIDVKERSFEALALNTGSIVRVQKKSLEDGATWQVEAMSTQSEQNESKLEERKQFKIKITFPHTTEQPMSSIVVDLFSHIWIELKRKPNTYKFEGSIVRPVTTKVFTRQESSAST